MASTYTDIGTELMTTGENASKWGTKTNTNIKIIEEAIRGYVAVSIAGSADTTALTYTDGSTGDTARNAVIALTGTITGNQVVTVTAKEKWWIIDNQTSGAYTVQVLVSGQTGVTWATTDKGTKILYCNGTDVIDTGISSTGTFDLDGGELTLDADSDTSITASTDDQIDFEIAGADDFTMTANAFNVLTGSHVTFADSANAKFGTGNDMLVYHDGSNSYITNATGALKLATETSGIALTIGHTTSETTIADNLTVTGTLTGTLATAAQGTVTSLGTLTTLTVDNVITNGTTIGHTDDTDLMTLADGVLTVAGELDAATLDISGNADIDGTLEADAITINSTAIGSIYGAIAGSSSIVTTGALDSGSITSGFGTIDTGSSTITTTGLISGGSLDIDNVLINGTTIGHTDDTDLITLADGVATVAGELDAATLDISGNADIDGTTNLDAVDIDGAVQIDGTTTIGVDGTGLDVKFFGDTSGSFLLWDQSDDALELTDSSPIKIGDSGDMQIYHDGTNSYLTNSQGALKVATETSGIAITIGHTTSEVTVADNLTVTGTLTLGSGAELTEAELEFLDGITAGTAAASKAMVADSNIDITGGRNITISGELDAATGDFSGDVDVDGTLEADAITINGTAIGSVYGVVAGSSSIVTTGALDSGSITSGFGAIDNGTSNIRSATITAETAFVPDASGGADLGTTALEFNDLFLNDSGSIQFGDDQDTTLVHTDGTGLTLNSTNKFCFRDSALFINSSTDGQLDIDADTEVEITATTVDLNGILDVSGVIVAGGQISASDGTAGAPSISNTGDLNSGLYFSAADTLAFSAGGTAQFTMADGAIAPVTDNDVDLGTSGLEFKDGYFDGTLYCDQLNLAGTNHTTIEDPTALAIALG